MPILKVPKRSNDAQEEDKPTDTPKRPFQGMSISSSSTSTSLPGLWSRQIGQVITPSTPDNDGIVNVAGNICTSQTTPSSMNFRLRMEVRSTRAALQKEKEKHFETWKEMKKLKMLVLGLEK